MATTMAWEVAQAELLLGKLEDFEVVLGHNDAHGGEEGGSIITTSMLHA
jgi:hypothetical protein